MINKLFFLLVLLFIQDVCSGQILLESDESRILSEYNWMFKQYNGTACVASESDIKESNVEECAFIHEFKMFPNPTEGIVQIEFKGAQNKTTLIISSLEGKAIHSEELNLFEGQFKKRIQLNDKGLFIVSIIQGNEIFTKKLIIK